MGLPELTLKSVREAAELRETTRPPAVISAGIVLADKYRVEEELGRGGMGTVYRGEHLALNEPVAIKILHEHVAAEPNYVRRFRREAKASLMLNHPNVVKVLDFGAVDRTFYIVMEFLEGKPVCDWQEELGRLPTLEEIRQILMPVTGALEAAHELGIVHRDLKPDNIMVATGETLTKIKVVDFGIAHVEDARDIGPTLTQADAIAGTPAYMSPEQSRSLKVGPSTDLYALGCILTELLQGEPPFIGAAPMDVISQHLFVPPPELNRPDDAEPIPELLERLRLDLLAKHTHQRPQTAKEVSERFLTALDPEKHAEELPARTQATARSRSERLPKWKGGKPDTPGPDTQAKLHVTVLSRSFDPDGYNKNCAIGLAAQSIQARTCEELNEIETDLVVLDFGDNVDGARKAVEDVRGARPQAQVVVCLSRLGSDELNKLIEAGAADVMRYPIDAASLARRLKRFSRRLRKKT